MMRGRLRALAGAMLLLPALLACGGTEEPGAPPTYYADLAELTQQLDDDNTAADGALHDELEGASPDEVGDLFSRVTIEGADRLDALLEEASSLSAPEEAREAHQELIDASTAMAAEDRVTADAMAGLSSDELGGLEPRPAYVAAEERVDQACSALQDLADEAGSDVDLCVGMFAPPGTG